jgi:hypothetical protein
MQQRHRQNVRTQQQARRCHRHLSAPSQYEQTPALLASDGGSLCCISAIGMSYVQATGACQMDDAAYSDLVDTVAMATLAGMDGDMAGALERIEKLTGTAYERCGSCLSLQSKASFESMVRTCIGASLR